jgi:hypothetical protein
VLSPISVFRELLMAVWSGKPTPTMNASAVMRYRNWTPWKKCLPQSPPTLLLRCGQEIKPPLPPLVPLRMSQMLLEVGDVLFHQPRIALDGEEILRVLLLGRLREIERPRDQCSPVDGPYAPESFSP